MEDKELSVIKAQWREHFHQDPPFKASRDFMQGHIAWAQQAKEHGGLKRKVNNQLKQMIQQLRVGTEPASDTSLIIKPGTKLIREYQGEKHEVITTADGFQYKGKAFGSLSSIAREITGTKWNGKVFFGVKKL